MSASVDKLLRIMAALRDPDRGCPWDLKQDFTTIAPYTIEEAYEVSDAIERGDMEELRDELGDLLLQVVFHARMASELEAFDFEDVADAICTKMIERHPHVFERPRDLADTELRDAWEAKKESERRRRGGHAGALDGVARALPALSRSEKLLRRAARKGLDWPWQQDATDRCREALAGLEEAARSSESHDWLEEKLGDLLFACAAVAARRGLDAEKALRRANARFEARFRRVETTLAADCLEMDDVPAEELTRLWTQSEAGAG